MGSFCEYTDGDAVFEGYFSAAVHSARAPCVLVGHAWDGPNGYFNSLADELAGLGYHAFAIDVYGKGVRGRIDGDNSALMNPLLADRLLLQRRVLAGFRFAQSHPLVLPDRVAMVGHCFGGLCALDLARCAPAGVAGVVALHAPLTAPAIPRTPIHARVLLLHGWADPVAPPADLLAFADEMTAAGARWEVHAYGHAKHAFTFVGANIPSLGIAYDEYADRRSKAATRAFLTEVLGEATPLLGKNRERPSSPD